MLSGTWPPPRVVAEDKVGLNNGTKQVLKVPPHPISAPFTNFFLARCPRKRFVCVEMLYCCVFVDVGFIFHPCVRFYSCYPFLYPFYTPNVWQWQKRAFLKVCLTMRSWRAARAPVQAKTIYISISQCQLYEGKVEVPWGGWGGPPLKTRRSRRSCHEKVKKTLHRSVTRVTSAVKTEGKFTIWNSSADPDYPDYPADQVSESAARTLPSTRAGGQDDGS